MKTVRNTKKPEPRPGTLPTLSMLTDIPQLVAAYYTGVPDPHVAAQRVAFGTSGHRGSSLDVAFNEWHVAAITQAICELRRRKGIDGPLFIGIDTHALSVPACATALEVLAANGVDVMLSANDDYTPTPAVSLAILRHNRGRSTGLADGIVVTPSHNPPRDGGFKYNPPNGGPADVDLTNWIEARANALLLGKLRGVRRMTLAAALRAATTHRYDFRAAYVADLGNIINLDVIRGARIRMGVDPLGGAGVHYWPAIAERYKLDLTITNGTVDPTFRFVPLDWDGQIRMDPSSPYAMQSLIAQKKRFDVAFACDTDHDRHGIVTRSGGLVPPNHYLCVAIDYLFTHRSHWRRHAAVGKTVVSSALIDRVTARLGRRLYEVPVGFKWYVDGLLAHALGFAGEESAGACFLRRNGSVWTTDKDGIVPALLSAEITARTGRDPSERYKTLAHELGEPVERRVQAAATPAQKARLARLAPRQFHHASLAGEKILRIEDRAPGNGAPIGGLRVATASGWFAARPSGTEDIYKIYAESFRGVRHLDRIVREAQAMVDDALGATPRAHAADATMNGARIPRGSDASGSHPAPGGEVSAAASAQATLNDAMLESLQRDAFNYFDHESNPQNGLVLDKTTSNWPSSIAATGLGLTAYPVAVKRGFIARDQAVARVLTTMRFFIGSRQGPEPDATGYHGFYYHFLDMQSGRRAWQCELSTVDSAILFGGMLAAAEFFDGDSADEREIRSTADALYRRADWQWAQNGGTTVTHGWKPESGFLQWRWRGYDEALLLYVLGLGSPEHPLPDASYAAWVSTYEWKEIYGQEFVYAGPLFIHQMSHIWIDFRGIQDAYMRAKGIDYFENSRRATYAQRLYAIDNPLKFAHYGADCWGITASDGPGPDTANVDGIQRVFYDYLARGVPYGPDDGTVAPWGVVASLPFAPEIVLPAIEHMVHDLDLKLGNPYGFKATFNPTYPEKSGNPNGWVSPWHYGLNQGPICSMIENYRSDLVWRLMRGCPYIVKGLQRAGFQGGWL